MSVRMAKYCAILRESDARSTSWRKIASASRSMDRRSGVTSPRQRTDSPQLSKEGRVISSSGTPSQRPSARTSSLNSRRSGSTVRQPSIMLETTWGVPRSTSG